MIRRDSAADHRLIAHAIERIGAALDERELGFVDGYERTAGKLPGTFSV
ncbi:hypothetical protein [Leucobacter chinensis]|nr:hypothetical protein [Leucobacter chinensis]